MTISHRENRPDLNEPFVFAELGGFTCSICAPNAMTQAEVEAYALQEFPGGAWEAVDKSKLGLGSATPNPSNWEPKARRHWFLMRGGG